MTVSSKSRSKMMEGGGEWRPTDWSKRDALNLLHRDDLAIGEDAGNMIDAKPAQP